jgi:hypothetical protein
MRHDKTFRVRAIKGLFIGVCCSWMLIVLNQTAMWEAWKAWGLSFLGAALIAAIGLRLLVVLDTRWFIQDCNTKPKYQPIIGDDPLVACQVAPRHRQPYFSARVN